MFIIHRENACFNFGSMSLHVFKESFFLVCDILSDVHLSHIEWNEWREKVNPFKIFFILHHIMTCYDDEKKSEKRDKV